MLFQAGLANFNPHAPTTVDFHNDTRAPLLLIAGGKDHSTAGACSMVVSIGHPSLSALCPCA